MSYRVPRTRESNRAGDTEPRWKPTASSRKMAMLFGNNKYTGKSDLKSLSCCENDAMDMRSSLIKLGFDAHAYIDKNGGTMQRIADTFISKIKPNDLVVFYYSGHGSQSFGQNILYGVDGEFINVTQILSAIGERQPYAIVLLLDCCRSPSRHGLAVMSDFKSVKNVFVGFACSENQQALAKKERNSCYTKQILYYIERGGSFMDMLQLAARKLEEELKDSKQKQSCWQYTNYGSNHVFVLKHDVVEQTVITTKLANMKLTQTTKPKQKKLTTVKETSEYQTKGASAHVVNKHDESDSYSSSNSSESDDD